MVQALTPWHSKPLESVCLEYDGNKHTVSTSAKMSVLRSRECPHYPANKVDDPFFDVRIPWTPPAAERHPNDWEQPMRIVMRVTGTASKHRKSDALGKSGEVHIDVDGS